MTDVEIAATAVANQDMARARREGSVLIAQTRIGLVELFYIRNTYLLRSCEGQGMLAEGPAKKVRPVLAYLYQQASA